MAARKKRNKFRAALAGETCTHCPSPASGPHKMSCALGKDREVAPIPFSAEGLAALEELKKLVKE